MAMYKMCDGSIMTETYIMMDFIKCTEQTKKYELFKLAIIEKEIYS